MNFQRLKVRGVQMMAQKKSAIVRQDNALEMLQSEAEKVRNWQIKVDMNIKEKDKEVKVLKETVDSLQKNVLECKIGKENAERRLEDQIKTHETTNKRLESTRQMCMLIKDEFRRIEDTLTLYSNMSETLQQEDEKKAMKIQKLLDDFVSMEEFVTEASESWKRKYNKMRSEKDEMALLLKNTKDDVTEKNLLLRERESKLSAAQSHIKELSIAKNELHISIRNLLAVIGKMKRGKIDAVAKLKDQVKLAAEILEEKNQQIQSVSEQYEFSKQTWHASEEDFNATLRNMNMEKETLLAKLDVAVDEKNKLKGDLENVSSERSNLHQNVATLQERISLSEDKEVALKNTIANLQNDIVKAKDDQETLQEQTKLSLSEKFEECQQLGKRIAELEMEVESARKEVNQYSAHVKEKSIILTERDEQVEALKSENIKMASELEEVRVESSKSLESLKLDIMKTKQNFAGEAKKSKKMSDDRKRWEKKALDLEKNLHKVEEKYADNEEKFRQQLEQKDQDLKTLKNDFVDANARIKELLEIQTSLQDETQSRTHKQEKENADLQCKVDKFDEVTAKQRDEIEFLRQHLKDTEKMLSEEGFKILKKNDQIEDFKKSISELEYSLKKRSIENEDLGKSLQEKESEIKMLQLASRSNVPKQNDLKECSFSPSNIGNWRRNLGRAEAKRPKIELTNTELEIRQLNTRKSKPWNNAKDIYGTAADELLSEVSFGSMPLDTDVTSSRKYLLASSTPKISSKAQAQFNQKNNNKTHKRATKKSQTRKSKVVKSESKAWFNSDDVYGFHE